MKTSAPVALTVSPAGTDDTRPRQQILIVDADDSARSVLAVALGREGFETQAVSSSIEAMRLLGPGAPLPEMVVVASELREENGFSFAAQLRGDRRTGSIPLLLLAKGDEPQFDELSRVLGNEEILLKPAYARDIATLARLQLCPVGKDGGRILDCAVTPVAHLLRAVLATSRSGVLELEQGRGHIAFRRGRVLDASFDGLHGINALVRSIALARGGYKISARNLAFDAAFHCTLKELITVVFPRLQRWEELTVRSLPMDATLGLDFPALARALTSMPDAVNAVVRLFDGQRDVRQVLMDSPLDETVTLEIATRLYLMGVVVSLKPEDGIAKRDPRLFEPRATEANERMEQLFSANPTPIQLPNPIAVADETWDQETRGSGLEMSTDPSDGWSTTRTVDLYADQDLAAEVQAQLDAFNIQPVVEHESAPVFATDLMEFTTGDAPDEQPMEAALNAPIAVALPTAGVSVRSLEAAFDAPPREATLTQQPSVGTLENEFFSIEQTPASTARPISVSQAVLGFPAEDELAEPASPTEQFRIGPVGWTVVVGLLVGATALTAWQLSANKQPAAVDAPSVATIQAQPIHLSTIAIDQPSAVTVERPDSALALVEATRLYDEGKLSEAKVALEELVGHDPSNTTAWLMLGLARFDSRDIAGAEEAANTVLAIDPKVARAYLLRATILIAAKNRPQAVGEIEKYLELEPNGPFADEAKALLQR